MTISEFISKAIDGGWNKGYEIIHFGDGGDVMLRHKNEVDRLALITAEILLDPKAWEAVAKTEKWKGGTFVRCECTPSQGFHDTKCPASDDKLDWKEQMHQMITALCAGKSIEEFIKSL